MNNLLEQLKANIQNKISMLNYNTWFKPIAQAKRENGSFVLFVPNKFVADWINDYYSDLIVKELFLITKENLRLAYQVCEDSIDTAPPDEELAAEQKIEKPRPMILSGLNEKYSFERFVVGS